MNEVISWVVFAGSWLLVAGPLYQGSLELTETQRDQFTSFRHKAAGWFTVAAGGTLLAAGETWQLIEHHDWPVWLFWVLIVIMLAAAMFNTAARLSGGRRTRHPAGAEPASAGRTAHRGHQ